MAIAGLTLVRHVLKYGSPITEEDKKKTQGLIGRGRTKNADAHLVRQVYRVMQAMIASENPAVADTGCRLCLFISGANTVRRNAKQNMRKDRDEKRVARNKANEAVASYLETLKAKEKELNDESLGSYTFKPRNDADGDVHGHGGNDQQRDGDGNPQDSRGRDDGSAH